MYETSISDHYFVYCVRKFRGASKKQHKCITRKQLKHFDQVEFINDLVLVDWKGTILHDDDINITVAQWTKGFH